MAVVLLGAPNGFGAGQAGCEGGPAALRSAGLREALVCTGRAVVDGGDVVAGPVARRPDDAGAGHRRLPEVAAWAQAIHDAVGAIPAGDLPVILGGDHSIALGTVPALSARAARSGRPLFLLWLDAHPDCHTLASSVSGNLHGLPLAHAIGERGPSSPFPASATPVPADHVLMLGIRDVDAAEADLMRRRGIESHDPAAIHARGVGAILEPWLRRVAAAGGELHVSLDADVLDPSVAPGVGTPVSGGLSCGEMAAILRQAAASGLLGSLELVEVNPLIDPDGRTAGAMVGLAAVALGHPAAAGRRRAA